MNNPTEIAENARNLHIENVRLEKQLSAERAKAERLAEDGKRMDWLERNTQWSDPHHRMKVTFPMETVKFTTLREAIDAALAEYEKEK